MTSHEEPSVYYASIEEQFLARPGVTLVRALSRPALALHGKIFAFARRADALVVKIGTDETATAVAAGEGEPLRMGQSRVMKAWLEVPFDLGDPHRWARYVEQAYENALAHAPQR
jgi:hypothetical protein